MAKTHSGGGRTPTKQSVRTGAPARGVNPAYANQPGQQLYHKEHFTPKAAPMPAGGGVKLGNEVALNVGKGGPGAGRSVHRTGSQGTHGPVNPGSSPLARDILGSFGPERSKP